ncbi:MAG TPA: protein kinase, partial [Kofleriaceae bacterium]|nr:protein kinase [Kofleriaceae bacterium]
RRRVDPQLAAWIAHEVLDALDYAHNLTGEDGARMGIVHRDISPSNILLGVRGDIKLVDFGIARQQDPDRAHKSKSGTLKGKYGYMSPEQVIEQSLDARSDLFSVGVVLAELLTGRRLFAATNELDVLLMVRDAKLVRFEKYGGHIAPDLADIVRTALRKSADERWQTAAQFRDALGEWLFEHRHRMASRAVADVVVELRDAVIERRNRTVNAGTTVLDDVSVTRPPEESIPMPVVGREPSMPLISVSYEAHAEEPAVSPRPVTVSDLARVARPRADTVNARPASRSPVGQTPPPISGLQVKRPTPPRSRSPSSIRPREQTDRDGIVELPIADTISAAVEAITLPNRDEASGRNEDSAMRAFDDLQSEAEIREPLGITEELVRGRPPTPPALSDIPEPPDDLGEFSITSPLRVLFRLMTARATGLLLVAVGGIKKEIYVRDGQPEYVSSNVASELFGNYLVSKNVLSDGELAMALAMMPHYGGKLGDTLVGLGLLKPLEVFRHLTRQVRTKIIDVCTWNKGSFGWYAGRENPREAFPLDFNAYEILGAGAMAMSDDFVEAWIARNAGLRLRAARTRRVGPERFEVKGLVELCELLDGKRSVADLVEVASDRGDRLKTGRMLTLLESCDLARPS